jgi:NAD-dependent deacetylase
MELKYKNDATEILDIINKSEKICVITGAGISTASGIPDFRGKKGIYTDNSENIFDLKRFLDNPDKFYSLGKKFFSVLFNAKPNSSHYLLVKLEKLGKIDMIITQNIDDLHKKAGSQKIIEIHGNFTEFKCLKCDYKTDIDKILDKISKGEIPYCEKCDNPLKPNVVFFGEKTDSIKTNKAIKSASESDLCLVLGSSLTVQPVAKIPEYALDNDAKLIIINKGQTYLDDYSYKKYNMDTEKLANEMIKILEQKKFLIF